MVPLFERGSRRRLWLGLACLAWGFMLGAHVDFAVLFLSLVPILGLGIWTLQAGHAKPIRGLPERRASFRVASGQRFDATLLGGMAWAITFYLASLMALDRLAAVCPLVFIATILATRALLAGERIDIGPEGIFYSRRLWSRFFPYRHIKCALASGRHLEVYFRGRAPLDVVAVGDGARFLAQMMAREINDGCFAFGGFRPDEGAAVLLAPGRRSPGQWVKAMRALGGSPGYRDAAVDEDRLTRVVVAAWAQRVVRVGAAVALSTMGDPARARVREAADACAHPGLKQALTRVATGTDESALEAAVAPLIGPVRRG